MPSFLVGTTICISSLPRIRYKKYGSFKTKFLYELYIRVGIVSRCRVPTAKKSEIDWKAVGRRIRELRGFEINQGTFARDLGVSQGQLSKYEQGNSEIGAEVLLRLARKSGKTMEWLLTGRNSAVRA